MDPVTMLAQFGLTQQEAKLYAALHACRRATGYELAKSTGISRSNAYGCLSHLVEKGAAYQIDGRPARYEAVAVGEFCRNRLRVLQETGARLEAALPLGDAEEAAYLTIRGRENIVGRIGELIAATRHRIYLSMAAPLLTPFLPGLGELVAAGKKVVVITDGPVELAGATLYQAPRPSAAIRVISDSSVALTGDLQEGSRCSCLFSRKENLVNLLKDSVKNEIRLIELTGGSPL